MKSTKILAILIVGVVSVSLLARVERPDKVPKAFQEIWNALLDLQEQMDSIQPTPGPQGPPGPTLGIYDSLGLSSSGDRESGDAGGRTLYNLGSVGIGTGIDSLYKLSVQGGGASAINCNRESGQGLWAHSEIGVGVASSSTSGYGVTGHSGTGIGVYGASNSSYGVYGVSNDQAAVVGDSVNFRGIWGISWTGDGVYGQSDSGNGVVGESFSGGKAGYFKGDVQITGELTKAGGSFKIDHPLDPENKFLQHSFVESPDMMNIYNGMLILDENGQAVVQLPDYFEALNRDFRYQLTCIGGFAPVYIAEKISDKRFKIAGGKPGMEVSWQVTGIRRDAYADKNRVVVEENKSLQERGYYLHPEAYGLPKEKSIETVRKPRLSQIRELAKR